MGIFGLHLPKKVDNAIGAIGRGAVRSVAQINPLDNGRTWQNSTPTNNRSVIGQITHSGASNVVGQIAKPIIRSSLALNQGIGNLELKIAGRPTQNAQQYTQGTGIKGLQKFTGYTGTKGQIAGDLVNTAATVAMPGSSTVTKNAFRAVAPKFVPDIANRALANAGVGAVGGAINNASYEAGNSQIHSFNDLKNSALTGAKFGAVLGAGGTLAAPVVKAGGRVTVKGAKAYNDNFSVPALEGKIASNTEARNQNIANREAAQLRGDTRGVKVLDKQHTDLLNENNKLQKLYSLQSKGVGGSTKKISSGQSTPGVDLKTRQPVLVQEANKGLAMEVKRAISDKDQVILDELRSIEKQTGQKGLVDKFMYNSNMQRGSNSIANNIIGNSENLKAAIGGLSKKDYQGFSDYANARTELSTADKAVATSKSKDALKAIVDNGHAQYSNRFAALNAHYKDLAKEAYKGQLIDKATYDRYVANNDYVRLAKDMSNLAPSVTSGRGNSYSLGSTVLSKARKGSKRENLPAGETAAAHTQQIFGEVARNKTATQLVDTLHANGLATQLINSEDVIARRNAFKNMKELKPIRDALQQETKKAFKSLSILSKRNDSLSPQILDKIQKSQVTVRGKAMKIANGVDRLPGRSKTLSKLPNEADIHEAFQQYLDGNPKLVRQMYEFIGNKSEQVKLKNKLDGLKAQYEAVQKERRNSWLTAKQHSDKITTNKNTISILRNGIRETYEVSPEIKQAADNINPYHMNVVMQIMAAPGRLLRAGVTGLNPVFIARNLIKDQAGSAINSEHALATHNPVAFFSGLKNAVQGSVGMNHDPLWQDFLKHYGDQTSYDLTRNVKNTQNIVNEIRGGTGYKALDAVKSPLRTLENVAQVTEKSTRFQNFRGEYKKAIDQGLTKEQASEKAAIAAWQNSVDFSRAGTWGRVINTVIPYWNPATQGVRQMGRTFSKHPIKSPLMGTAILGVPLAAATAWNLSNADTKATYDKIPEYEKDNNLVLVEPSKGGGYIKIPLPPGYKDVFMPVRRGLEAYNHDKPIQGKQIAQDILQATTGPIATQTKGQFIGSLTPQVVKPLVQQGLNKDLYTGKPIVPDYMNNATDANGNPIPESQKAYKNTSGTARFLGQATNTSPVKVEKFIKDTGGTVGLNILNATDQVLAKRGVIPSEQVGGQSVKTGFKRSFTGNTQEFAKSAGAQYYDNLKKVTSSLNGNEQAAFNALHPAKKNFLGDTIYTSDKVYDPAARLDIYNRYPKVFEADKKLDTQSKIHNPLFGLEQWQVKKVLEKDNLPPGAKDPELSKLYSQDWYADYAIKKSKYFTDSKAAAEKAGKSFSKSDNPYPVTDPTLQKTMDYYSSLPKGTGARSKWIKSNPGQWAAMQNQFAMIDNWQNIQRGKRGLDQTEGATGVAAGYGDSNSSSYGSYSKKPKSINPSTYLKSYGVAKSKKLGRSVRVSKVSARARGTTGGKITVRSKKIRLA